MEHNKPPLVNTHWYMYQYTVRRVHIHTQAAQQTQTQTHKQWEQVQEKHRRVPVAQHSTRPQWKHRDENLLSFMAHRTLIQGPMPLKHISGQEQQHTYTRQNTGKKRTTTCGQQEREERVQYRCPYTHTHTQTRRSVRGHRQEKEKTKHTTRTVRFSIHHRRSTYIRMGPITGRTHDRICMH